MTQYLCKWPQKCIFRTGIQIVFLISPLVLTACHSTSASRTAKQRETQPADIVNWADIHIEPKSNIDRDAVVAIIQARGGKDPGETWTLDRQRDGVVRIQKARKDATVYAPGTAVEFWHLEKKGKWKRSPTA